MDSDSWLQWAIVFGVYPSNGGGGGGGVTPQQVQKFAFNYEAATGANDAFVVNLNPAVTALTDGLIVAMSSGALENETPTPTLQINALTPTPIVLWGSALAPGDIQPNTSYLFIYNLAEDKFSLINPSVSTANAFLVQSNGYNSAIDSGTVNAYVVTLNLPPEGSFSVGFPIYMQVGPGNSNTGASTLTVNGATDDITLRDGSALPAGSLVGGQMAYMLFDNGAWVLMNPVPQVTVVTLADETAQLPQSFSLGTLTPGLLKIDVNAAIASLSTAVNGVDYWAPGDVLTVPGAPSVSNEVANKGYVDSVAAGLNPQAACYAASTANLSGYTYSPGASGVGATLTAGGNGVFTLDGQTVPQGERVLYKNDTTGSGAYNGVYILTNAGSVSTVAVLTRAVNYDNPVEINNSGLIPVQFGTLNAGTGWLNVSTVVTVGVTPILFMQFGQISGVVQPGNGGTGVANAPGSTITLNGALSFAGAYVFNQSLATSSSPSFANLTLTGGVINNASGVPTFAVAGTTGNDYIQVVPTTTRPEIQVVGSSTDAGLLIRLKGAGPITTVTTANNALTMLTGTASQHTTAFSFPNTAASQTVTYPDASGTVTLLGNASTGSGRVALESNPEFLSGGGRVLTFSNSGIPVNQFTMVGGSSGVAPVLRAVGTDTNIDLALLPKGTGTVTTPSIQFLTTSGIIGTTTNNNAAGGSVGEYVEVIVNRGSAVSLTSGAVSNVALMNLTQGDWEVFGYVGFTGTAVSTSGYSAAISQTSATMPSTSTILGSESLSFSGASAGGFASIGNTILSLTPTRLSVANGATVTQCLVATLAFTGGTGTAYGTIRARRIR